MVPTDGALHGKPRYAILGEALNDLSVEILTFYCWRKCSGCFQTRMGWRDVANF